MLSFSFFKYSDLCFLLSIFISLAKDRQFNVFSKNHLLACWSSLPHWCFLFQLVLHLILIAASIPHILFFTDFLGWNFQPISFSNIFIEDFNFLLRTALICRIFLILFIYFFNKFIYLFLAELGLCCWARAFSSCSERGLLFVVVRRLLIAVASLVAEQRL